MAGETQVTVIGNLTADPELRYTQNGLAVVNFTIASTPRVFDRQSNDWKDGDTLFLRSSAWREFAENIAQLTKGTRVIAQGNLVQRSWQDNDGNKRSSIELQVTDIGTAVRRTAPRQGGAQQSRQAPAADQWYEGPSDPDVPF